MLAMLGAMGVLLAGLALPMLFDDDDDDRGSDAAEDETPPEAESGVTPLDVATREEPEPEEAPDSVGAGADPGGETGADTPDDAAVSLPDAPVAPPDSPEEDVPVQGAADNAGEAMDSTSSGSVTLSGSADDDTLTGDAGPDTIGGSEGDDLLEGGDGDDLLVDGAGADTLSGGAGNDTLEATAAADHDRDFLDGGAGDDSITVGRMDFVTGGEGADIFTLTSGIGIGEQAEIVDFKPTEDKLVLIWDDSAGGTAPELELGTIEDGAGLAQIILDGVVVAHVSGAADLRVEDIQLLPASSV